MKKYFKALKNAGPYLTEDKIYEFEITDDGYGAAFTADNNRVELLGYPFKGDWAKEIKVFDMTKISVL